MGFSSFALWASLAGVSYCLPSRTTAANPLLRRDGSDPADLSWIKNWASVGDSYSAGIGYAPRPIDDNAKAYIVGGLDQGRSMAAGETTSVRAMTSHSPRSSTSILVWAVPMAVHSTTGLARER